MLLGESPISLLAIASCLSPDTILCSSGKHFRPHAVLTKVECGLLCTNSCHFATFLDIAISLRCQGILQPSPLLQNSLLHTSFSQKGRSCIFAERLNSYKFTFISTEHLHKLAFAHFFRTAKHTNFCIALCIALCTHDEDGGGSRQRWIVGRKNSIVG